MKPILRPMTQKKLLLMLKTDPKVSYEYWAKQMNVTATTIKRTILELKYENKIRRIGSVRGGVWEVVSETSAAYFE